MRWCNQCHVPVRELSVRAPIHHDDFVGPLRHESGHAPHWSRWGKDATTFGPTGRVVATIAIVSFLVVGAFTQFVLIWIVEVGVSIAVLRDVWRPAWVVPDDPSASSRPRLPDAPLKDWLFDREDLTGAAALAVVALGIGAAVMYGSPVVKLVTIWGAVLFGGYLFYRGFLSR